MPLFWKPLDDSHQPFKRLRKLKPAVRGREPISERKEWECNRPRTTRPDANEQLCTYIGRGGKGKPKRGSVKKVVVSKSYKKQYNKDYYEFVKAEGKPRARFNRRQPNYKYRRPKYYAGGRGVNDPRAVAARRRARAARAGRAA